MHVTSSDVFTICDLVHELCGLHIDSSRDYLIESRLRDLVERHKCSSYGVLADLCRKPQNTSLRQEIIDRMTTQETLFFRDDQPFKALQFKVLPEMLDQKSKGPNPRRVRIWGAAASTGQEAYSLSIMLHEMFTDLHRWDIQILATDISDSALSRAREAIYTDFEVERGMPIDLRNRYMQRVPKGWQMRDSVRSLVTFQRLNLLDPLPFYQPFDIVLCRNVAIYFDKAQRRSLFERLCKTLTPDGALFVGASETLVDLGPRFRPHTHCRSIFYRPNQPLNQPLRMV